jgi:hypothetical protein
MTPFHDPFRSFIPAKSVEAPGRLLVTKRYFNSVVTIGSPANQGPLGRSRGVVIETDPTKNGGRAEVVPLKGVDGITHELSSLNGAEIDRKQGSGSTLGREVTRPVDDIVKVHVHGDEGNPLVLGAPGITYNLDIRIASPQGTNGSADVIVSATHDGFPGYEALVNRLDIPNSNPMLVYSYNPDDTGATPWSLLPFNQVDVQMQQRIPSPFATPVPTPSCPPCRP